MKRPAYRRFPSRSLMLFVWFVSLVMPQAFAGATPAGQWQGSLSPDHPSRLILLIDGSPGGTPRGTVYLLDQDNADWPHATSTLLVQDQSVTFRINNLDASFSGKLAVDGTLSGTWKQQGTTYQIVLAHVSGDAAWPIPKYELKSMPAAADPAFEVATIKPMEPNATASGFQLRGTRVHLLNESAEDIAAFAYGVHRNQIQGAPAWFSSQRWEIDGYADVPGAPDLEHMQSMCRKLLMDRFGLQMKQESRDLSVYSLEAGKQIPTLTRSLGKPDGPPDSTGNSSNGVHDVRYTNMTMDEFARDLAFVEDRPVVNTTGLTGRFDFRLRWSSPDALAASQNVGTEAPPVLFTAIREQLGLSLKATHQQAPVYVVTHVERPSAD